MFNKKDDRPEAIIIVGGWHGWFYLTAEEIVKEIDLAKTEGRSAKFITEQGWTLYVKPEKIDGFLV